MLKNLKLLMLFLAAIIVSSSSIYADDSFEYHGYARSGFAFNETLAGANGSMNIGSPKPYRLGNEPNNTYIENSFVKNWSDDDGLNFKFVFMGSWNSQERQNYANEGDLGVVRQAYVEATGMDFNKDIKVWGGSKFYAREDIYILDFYYRDLSGYGFGFENIKVGFANLNIAWIGNSSGDDAVDSDGNVIGKRIAHNIDVQLNEIKVPGGSLNLELDTIYMVGGVDEDTTANESNKLGYFSEISYNLASFLGFGNGFAKFVGQYGIGAGGNEYGFGNASGALYSGNEATIDDFIHYRGMFWGSWDITEKTSLQPAVVYDYFDNGDGREKTWITFGARLKQHITRNFAIAVEAGHEIYEQKGVNVNGFDDPNSSLTKITIAPTFTFDTGFYTRPEIRVFASYGIYGGDAVDAGQNSGAVKADKDTVMLYGAQVEAWW